MRRLLNCLLPLFLLTWACSAHAATGRVTKVLPQYLDLQGRHALTPSLYDRDAYQAQLRDHPEQRSGMQFAINWRARSDNPGTKLTLRIELRGSVKGGAPAATTLQTEVKATGSSHWATLILNGDDYRKFGELTAWRASLWDGDQLVAEAKSFLW